MAKKKPAEATSTKPKAVSKPKAPKAPASQESDVDPFVSNEFGVIPPQTGASSFGVPASMAGSSDSNVTQAKVISAIVSNAQTKDSKGTKENGENTADESQSPLSTSQDGKKNPGNVALESSADSIPGPGSVESIPRARLPGEKRHAYWERMRKSARLAGLPRGQGPDSAYVWATQQADKEFPYVEPSVEPLVSEETAAEPVSEAIPAAKPVPEPVSEPDQGVKGLGDFPKDWPKLPANAQLQVEIAWVSANRLLVRDGTGVNLSRAMSPPPSYAALSWLETSILFPSKFADISVKATADQDDEKEFIKREKLAVEEIRLILKEMLDAK